MNNPAAMNPATKATLIEMYTDKLNAYRNADPAVWERNSAMMVIRGYGPLSLENTIKDLENALAELA